MSRRARAAALTAGTAAVAALSALGACGRVIAPAPPESAPAVTRDTTIPGFPLAIAARAARVLRANQYLTKRFGGDSTWGYQSTDRIAVRLRYSSRNDSTRVRLEAWGPCTKNVCVSADAAGLLVQLSSDEAPPQ